MLYSLHRCSNDIVMSYKVGQMEWNECILEPVQCCFKRLSMRCFMCLGHKRIKNLKEMKLCNVGNVKAPN